MGTIDVNIKKKLCLSCKGSIIVVGQVSNAIRFNSAREIGGIVAYQLTNILLLGD